MGYLVGFAIPAQGFRPRTHPGGALAGLARKVGGLGAVNICLDQNQNSIPCNDPNCTFGDCGSGMGTWPQQTTGPLCLDQSENQIACADPNCTYGDCISASVPAPPSSTSPSPTVQPSGPAGVPTGSYLMYTGNWAVTLTQSMNAVIAAVRAAIAGAGLQVTNVNCPTCTSINPSSILASAGIQSFQVQLQILVTGSGFALPSDAGSIVDHAVYTATGKMPSASTTTVQQLPGPSGAGSPPAAASQTMTQWFEQNAWWLALLAVGAVAVPSLLNRR